MFPSKAWSNYETSVKALGERRVAPATDTGLLHAIGLATTDGNLSEAGRQYFEAKFIRRDDEEAKAALRNCLKDYPPAAAICQFLAGVPEASKDNAESILRSQGISVGLNDRTLGSLLSLMSFASLINYARGKIEVLAPTAQLDSPPASIFISRATPYANKIWLRRILQECEGFIFWLDKHFLPVAFEPLWEAADGSRISEVKILSLRMESNSGRKALREYRDLRIDLAGRSIQLEWRVIDSSLVKDTHDRWIIGASSARNVPDVGTIYSGNNSELNWSAQNTSLRSIFMDYWTQAEPITD